MMDCEYNKYGCASKFSNNEHLQLHLQVLAHQHLKQVVIVLEKEIDKNKTLSTTIDSLQARLSQVEKKDDSHDNIKGKGSHDGFETKLKELESKIQLLQGLYEKNPFAEVKANGHGVEIKEEPHIKTGVQQPKYEHKPITKLDARGSANKLEEKAKEDKAREEKAKEEKAKEEKAKEEKAREEKAREEKAREEKAREDKAREAKKPEIFERGRSKTDEEVRRPDSRNESNVRSDSRNESNIRPDSRGDARVDPRAQSVTPPPFIVKSSSGDNEPQERKHTNMSLREEPRYIPTYKQAPQPAKVNNNMYDRSRAKTWSNYSSRKKEVDPAEVTVIPADAPLETGIIWEYDSVSDEWCRGVVTFRMTKSHFAEGALRTAHMMEVHGDISPADSYEIEKPVGNGKNFKTELPIMGLLGDKYVIKLSKTKVPIDRYFEDVKMQMVCVELAKKFNQQGTPKKVEFLTAWVLEIPKTTGGSVWCGLEHYIGGEFKKQSNNHGGVLEPRNTPQAFSHFTWEHTKHNLIVVDLQGVDDDYTDPQIHTKDGLGYGVGNLGKTGIDRFLKTHQCNAICQLLTLPLINSLNTKAAMQKMIKGTQQVPFIDDQLGTNGYPHLEVGDDVSSGEFNCVQTLTGHADRVVSLCVTSKNLFSGSSDGTLRVWSLPNLTFDRELNVHRKSVESICVNDQYLFTGSADHSIKVWDLTNFALVIALRDHVGEVNAIALTDKSLNYLISASFDKNIKVWSLRTFKCVQTLSGHSKCVKALAVSGSILFSGSNDGSIYMWSLKNLTCLFALDAHEGWVKALAVKDKTLFSGSFDFHVKEWKVTSFQNGSILADHNDNVNSLCLTDRFLISGSDDKTAIVWDITLRKVVAVLKGHRLGVQAVVTDGKQIYTASDDSSIKVWKWFG